MRAGRVRAGRMRAGRVRAGRMRARKGAWNHCTLAAAVASMSLIVKLSL